jgi:exopolyphosphatase/guanosine-5'-triphosphate,3'-diphosphate pyrophosphatase
MEPIRRAVIDIGTNSIKLLVADVSDAGVEPVIEESEQTRLGAGFFGTNRLQPEAVARTAQAVAGFVGKARDLRAVSIRIIATSAARDAVNPGDLTSAIEAAAGLKVEIISGDQEADLAYHGVATDVELAAQPLLLVDVGGGSTEFILGRGGEKLFRKSFQLGTVRLLEKLPQSDPPSAQELAACRDYVGEFFDRQVRPALAPLIQQTETAHDKWAASQPGASAEGEGWGEWASFMGDLRGRGSHGSHLRSIPVLRSRSEEEDPVSHEVRLVGTGGTATILARMAAQLDIYDRKMIEATRLNAAQVHLQVKRLWGMPLAERRTITGLPKNRADVILPGVVIYEQLMGCFNFAELRITTRGLRFGALRTS